MCAFVRYSLGTKKSMSCKRQGCREKGDWNLWYRLLSVKREQRLQRSRRRHRQKMIARMMRESFKAFRTASKQGSLWSDQKAAFWNRFRTTISPETWSSTHGQVAKDTRRTNKRDAKWRRTILQILNHAQYSCCWNHAMRTCIVLRNVTEQMKRRKQLFTRTASYSISMHCGEPTSRKQARMMRGRNPAV